MFTVSEKRLPARASLTLVEDNARSILERFPHPPDWDHYLQGHKIRLAFDVDYARRYLPPGASILEVGAAPYFLTLPLLRLGFKVSPLDNAQGISGVTAEFPDAAPLTCDLDRGQIPAADASFDAIIVNEVIEHLRIDLIHSVRELYRVLKPGGVLMMSTPNLRSFIGLHNLLFKGEAWAVCPGIYEQYSLLEQGFMGHVREYAPGELKRFFERIGLRVDGIIYRGNYSRRHVWYWLTLPLPQFRPYFSLICSKPADASAVRRVA